MLSSPGSAHEDRTHLGVPRTHGVLLASPSVGHRYPPNLNVERRESVER
jgi:hypothetical protein